MGEISAASREQVSGVEEINKVITQMDETTQQNAALVEQTSAAARALTEPALSPRNQVAFFTMESAPSSPRSAGATNIGSSRRAAARQV